MSELMNGFCGILGGFFIGTAMFATLPVGGLVFCVVMAVINCLIAVGAFD